MNEYYEKILTFLTTRSDESEIIGVLSQTEVTENCLLKYFSSSRGFYFFARKNFYEEKIELCAHRSHLDMDTAKIYISVYKDAFELHKPLTVKQKEFEWSLAKCTNFLAQQLGMYNWIIRGKEIPQHIEQLGIYPLGLKLYCTKYNLSEETLNNYKTQSCLTENEISTVINSHLIVGTERLVITKGYRYLSFASDCLKRNKMVLDLAKGIVTKQLQGQKYKQISNSYVLIEFLGAPGCIVPVKAQFKFNGTSKPIGIILRKAFKDYCQDITAQHNDLFSFPESFFIQIELNSFKDLLRYATT